MFTLITTIVATLVIGGSLIGIGMVVRKTDEENGNVVMMYGCIALIVGGLCSIFAAGDLDKQHAATPKQDVKAETEEK